MRDTAHSVRPLIDAARQRDSLAIERLLQTGAHIDARDPDGRTALHHAVAGGDAATAACLLAYGANHALGDRTGHGALDPERIDVEVLHAVRQRYHRFRRSDEPQRAGWSRAAEWAADVSRRGIVKVAQYVEPDELQLMRREFAAFARNLGSRIVRGDAVKRDYFEEEHWWPRDRAFVTNNAFKYSTQLVRFSRRPELLEAARLYLGRPPAIERALALRYLAAATTDSNMFTWHHDLEDRRFKVMILLSDVGPEDQHMSYVCGSQALFHPYRMFLENSCPLDYCRAQLGTIEIYDATGTAGDVFLFDSNGAHRGIRRDTGRVRDVYLVELNASAPKIWGGDVDRRVVAETRLTPDPFARFLAAEKLWELPAERRPPSWVAGLRNVDAWLDRWTPS